MCHQTDVFLTANEKLGRLKITYPHLHGILAYFWRCADDDEPWLATAKVRQLLTNFDGFVSVRYRVDAEQGAQLVDADVDALAAVFSAMTASARLVAQLIAHPERVRGGVIGWYRTVAHVASS